MAKKRSSNSEPTDDARLVAPAAQGDEDRFDRIFRPLFFDDFIG